MRRLLLVAAAIVAAGHGGFTAPRPAAGQGVARPVLAPAPVEHTVRIDAVVTDRRGQPVTTLKASDFDLREDGHAQTLDDVRYVGDGRQLVAIFVDEYHLSPGDEIARTRAMLDRFIERALGPDDLFVVMKPLDSLFGVRLTADRQRALDVVASLDGRKGDYSPRTAYERNFWAGTPTRIEGARTQVAISALNALAVHLGTRPDGDRKRLILVTDGFQAPARSRGQEYLATVEGVVRSANRGRVSIYAIDPREPGAASDDDSRGDVLRTLTDDTTGRLLKAEDPGAALDRALHESAGYYVLTYRNAHLEDGRFHAIEVHTRRSDVTVRARAGYWAPSAEDRVRAEALARVAAERAKPPEPPRHVSPLIQPWFGMTRADEGKTRVTFVWEPATRIPGDRVRRWPTRLVLTARAADDSVAYEGMVLPTGAGVLQEADAAPAKAVFDVPPGRLRLQMKIEDAVSTELDADVRDLAVRDLRGVSIGTPEVLRARTVREFRILDDDPGAVPVASREFSRAERLLIRFQVYGGDASSRPAVTAELLNRAGKPMRGLDPTMGGGWYRIDLLLASLAPGEYEIALNADASGTVATETLPFRVTN